MKYWIALIAVALLLVGCGDSGTPSATNTLTILFEGLVTYVEDDDGDGVTVLIVDSREDRADDTIPVHLPIVTFQSSDGDVTNEIPWVLNNEDIEIVLDPIPTTLHLEVSPDVWAWTGSLSELTDKPAAITKELLNFDLDRDEIVARVRLEHGTLEVYDDKKAIYDTVATFETLGGTAHPKNYETPKVALLLKYTVQAKKIGITSHAMGTGLNSAKRGFAPSESAQAFIGNIPALNTDHGGGGKDHHFARLYDLVSVNDAVQYLPKFTPPGVGTRVCMGGRK